MKVIVIGAVAGGTSAATKISRDGKDAKIVMYERGEYVSYSSCSMPYSLSGRMPELEELAARNPEYFKNKYGIEVHTKVEIKKIDPQLKKVYGVDLKTKEEIEDSYDKLVIATGTRARFPDIEGTHLNNVFSLNKLDDAFRIREYVEKHPVKRVAIIGSGYIGLEMTESFLDQGVEVELINNRDKLTIVDEDLAPYIQEYLKSKGVNLNFGVLVEKITDKGVQTDKGLIEADLVLLATGVQPNVELAKEAGLKIGETGAIWVNKRMQTSDENIYACGDVSEVTDLITGKQKHVALGTIANKTGRVCGVNVAGGYSEFPGILRTAIFKCIDLDVAMTGKNYREAKSENALITSKVILTKSKPESMGGKPMIIKVIANAITRKILGGQIIGFNGVDKRIDVLATAITFGATIDDLVNIDLAYAPPFNLARDPINRVGMVMQSSVEEKENVIIEPFMEEMRK